MGWLGDRVGLKVTVVAATAMSALLYCAYAFASSFSAFLVVVALLAVSERGSQGVRQALSLSVLPSDKRVKVRAFMATAFNVGAASGAALAGTIIQIDTHSAYGVLALSVGAALGLVSILTTFLPAVPSASSPATKRFGIALGDKPFVAVTTLQGILSLHTSIFSIAVPLWIVNNTQAPGLMVGALAILNTVLCVMLQVRFSARSETVAGASRTAVTGGVAVLVASVAFALSASVSSTMSIALLTVGMIGLTFGELWISASAWGMAFGLAREDSQGQYQSLFALGATGQDAVGPLIITFGVLAAGQSGWIILGLGYLTVALVLLPVAKWAENRHLAANDARVAVTL